MNRLPGGGKQLNRRKMFDNLTSRGALPSLNALRAFEAMARTGSATQAAAELHVTHSAVSRQVKALEASLALRLFEGPRHRLALTEAGRRLAGDLAPAFDGIAAAVAAARSGGRDLHLAVHPSLSVKWLIPRLPRFSEAYPDIGVHLAELPSHAKTQRGADAVIRIADQGEAAGAHAFMRNEIGPGAAPDLWRRSGGTAVIDGPRLSVRAHPTGWPTWAQLTGVTLASGANRPLAHLHMALDAALSGWGAALLPWPLVAEDVLAGRLVAPYGFVPDGGAFVLSGAGTGSRALKAFRLWLDAEAAAMPAAPR